LPLNNHTKMKKLVLLLIISTISNVAFAQFPNLVASSNSPVCYGNTLSLWATHDTPAGGTTVAYNWSGPNNFTSSVQNPQRVNANFVNGTYTVTLTLSGNQTGTYIATTTVIANNSPISNVRSYLQGDNLNLSSNFCSGNNITLEAFTDYSSGVSYLWTGPNGFSSTLRTPTISNVTAANAGLYQVTFTFNNSSCVFVIKRNLEITIGSPTVSIAQNLVCYGGNVTLTPVLSPATSTVSSYLWEGPNNFTSNTNILTVNNLQERRTYKLTATFSGACSGTDVAYLNIQPIVPTPTVSASIFNCNATVTAAMPTAFVPAELTNYSWTGPNGFTSNQLSTPVSQAGAYTFTGTISGAGCNDVYTKTIVVPRIPSTITPNLNVSIVSATEFGTGQSDFCDGMNVFLVTSSRSGDQMNAMTYNWTGPNGFSSTLANPIVSNFSAAKAGVYQLTVTGIGNACNPTATATASTSVFIGRTTAPSITSISILNANSPGTAFCSGNTVQLGPNLSTFYTGNSFPTYSWTGPNGFSSTSRTPIISNVSAANEGVYSLAVTLTNGCVGTATATTTLTLNTLPSFSILERRVKFNNTVGVNNCLGSTVELIAQTGGSIINGISWTGPNGFSSNALSPQIVNATAANTGYYYATLNLGGECPATITRGAFITFTNASNLPFAISRENTNATGDNRSICTGSNIRLIASPNTTNYFQGTYSWTGPNGFTSNDIAPTIANIDASKLGTYTLNVSYTDGCAGTASSSITLNTNPPSISIGRIAGPVCAGLPVTLLVTNTTSADSYTWTGPNGFTSNQQRITIPILSASNLGTYSVTANISGSCPTTITASSNLAYDVAPTSASIRFTEQTTGLAANVQCPNTNLTLSVFNLDPTLITSYSWSGPNGFTSTLATPLVANAPAGTYTVSVGYLVCGAVSTVTGTLTLSNTKTISLSSRNQGGANATSYCAGSNIELFVNSTNPIYAEINSYSWAGPNGFSSTAAIPLISNATAANSGVYTITANFVSPCAGAVTATISITVASFQPNLLTRRAGQSNSFTFCSGTDIELYTTNTPNSGTISSYNWAGPNGFSSTATIPQIANIQAVNVGVYTLTVTVSGGVCAGTYISTANISVGSPVQVISTSQSTNQCPGGVNTLFATLLSQSFGAGTTFSWSGPNGFTSTSSSTTLTNLQPVNAGTYTVISNFPNTSGCAASGTATSTVTLTIGTPTVTANSRLQGSLFTNNTFCGGSNVELLTAISPSIATVISYSWTGPNGYTSTSAIPLLSNIQASNAGTYSVMIVFGGACAGTATATQTITITNTSLNIYARRVGQSIAFTFCTGTTVELFTAFSPITPTVSAYSWSGPNGFSSTAALPQVANFQVANAGIYTLSAVVTGACAGTYTSSVNLNATNTFTKQINLSTQSVQCPGGAVTFFPTSSAGDFSAGSTYAWSGPNNFSSTLKNPAIINLQAIHSGTYTLMVVHSSTEGCASYSGTSTLTTKLGIGNTAANILPNQNQSVVPNVNFPLNIEILGGTLPISMTLSNGSNYTVFNINGNNGNIYTANTSVSSAQTITISSISSSCGTGTGTGSAVISLANAIISITSGNWESASTWNVNRVPLATDNVIIGQNHTVTITTNAAVAKNLEYKTGARLSHGNTTAKLKLGL
jgi:trimeric autotransporter adhesin